jgi:hypothetical protein
LACRSSAAVTRIDKLLVAVPELGKVVTPNGAGRHGPPAGTGVAVRRVGGHRFLRLSNITALPDRSMLSNVGARASLIRQPVSCGTVHSVRTGRSAVAADPMKARRSPTVR